METATNILIIIAAIIAAIFLLKKVTGCIVRLIITAVAVAVLAGALYHFGYL